MLDTTTILLTIYPFSTSTGDIHVDAGTYRARHIVSRLVEQQPA